MGCDFEMFVYHVQACPSALPLSLLLPNVYDVPFSSLLPFNLLFPVECWYVRGRAAHTQCSDRGPSFIVMVAFSLTRSRPAVFSAHLVASFYESFRGEILGGLAAADTFSHIYSHMETSVGCW